MSDDDWKRATTSFYTMTSSIMFVLLCSISVTYAIGKTTKAETPSRKWDIDFLGAHTQDVLNVQQVTYFCIINNMVF